MLRGRDIICISSIDWDFIWQGHQQIMSTFAAHGNRVLFIENTGVRAPRVADLRRLRARLRNWWRGTKGFREQRSNLFVYSPLVLPFPYAAAARRINAAIMLRAVRRWMRAVGFGRPVVWTFLPTPLAHSLLKGLDPEVTVYYCIDDLASSSPQARRITRSEIEVFRDVDLVFVTSERLRHRAAASRSVVHLFPFGVDLFAFERVRDEATPLPKELEGRPRPIIGYVGGLHQWIDQELLCEVARALPQASFVLVGPPQTDVSKLAVRDNIHLLGARSHTEVPHFIKGFDVTLVPYRLSEYTANVYPTKLNEYLAMGKPVVSTELPEIKRINAEAADIIATASDAQGFVRAIERALNDGSDEARTQRVALARSNAWDTRVSEMSTLIEQAGATREANENASWEQKLRRIYRVARRRLAITAVAAIVLIVVLFYTPVFWLVAGPLKLSETPRPVDAIVVFAGGVGESGTAGGGYQERVKQAVDLYHQGHAANLVFSSGFSFVFREAELMRDLAVSLGVPTEAVILETKAANTHENVRFVSRILEDQDWNEALLVSSPYHMRRAVLVWRRAAPDIAVTPTPVPRSQFYAHGAMDGATVVQMNGILHEYAAIISYWWRGWI